MADCLCVKCKKNKNINDFKEEKIYKTCDECRTKNGEKEKKHHLTVKKLYDYMKDKYNVNETLKDVTEKLLNDDE